MSVALNGTAKELVEGLAGIADFTGNARLRHHRSHSSLDNATTGTLAYDSATDTAEALVGSIDKFVKDAKPVTLNVPARLSWRSTTPPLALSPLRIERRSQRHR